MFRVYGHFKTGIEISEIFKTMGYHHNMDYTWTTDSKNNQVIFTVADPKIETYMILKLGTRVL